MAIKALARGTAKSEIARLLGVTEGTVRYHVARMKTGAVDGRSRQPFKAEALREAIEHWRSQQTSVALNLAALHEWLCVEHGYDGSLRSIERFWKSAYPAPALRARRRVETPAGAQAQVDWAHFPGVLIGNVPIDLLALHMVLSWSRKEAIVWSTAKDMLSWLSCHSACFTRLGGVAATVRIDNEKTAIAHGAGAWGTINATYRRYGLMMRFHIDACAPRQPQAKGKVERRVRDQRMALEPYGRSFSDLSDLQSWTDARLEALSQQRRCPATGTSVSEAWRDEAQRLTPVPATLPEPFDAVATRSVGVDGLVAFEGRQYSVPFRFVGQQVEIRGTATSVQILKACETIAVHPRKTDSRLVIDQAHYDGPSTDRVKAPPPLGRMGARIQELASTPVAQRSIDLYAALAEVAR
ncbi:IS21 family transposase [Mesorhizobium sp. ISC15]